MNIIDNIVRESQSAMAEAASKTIQQRAFLLRSIAEEIELLGDALLETAAAESNLPVVRFQGERARTCGQLRMFADLIESGHYQDLTIDTAIPDRSPLPKPDLRSYLIPIGPIVVFGASNFPLAYSTAGGDTASALAAGCSVICKAHPAHAATSGMVANAIQKALTRAGYPESLFIHWFSDDFDEVKKLVQHPGVQGVGFTGSLQGGMAIYRYATERKQPIPVFAEMGSVNPVLLMPHALKSGAQNWADTYAAAINMGVGQFCTNPGLLFAIDDINLSTFADQLAVKMASSKDYKMLHAGIHANYLKRKEIVLGSSGVKALAIADTSGEGTGTPALAAVSADDFLKQPALHEEVFGPFSMIVVCRDANDMLNCLHALGGQLTATFVAEKEDEELVNKLLPIVVSRAGRVIFNGVPTGVEVCDAMVHGGPFPATTDSRYTAVGNKAIRRWLRPVAFQNFPQNLLPSALQNQNPDDSWRTIDGRLSKAAI